MTRALKFGMATVCVSALLTLSIPFQFVFAAATNPTDAFYRLQKYTKPIQLPDAWRKATGNTAMTIAVIDTGVDLTHPDLVGNLVPGYNTINPRDGVQDSNGHGTSVAGVLAATGNNNIGVAGVLWRAKIMPIKVLEEDGQGDERHLAKGIRYAVDHRAKIIVLSLGVVHASEVLANAITYAEQHEVLVVSAAGNEGKEVKYPAAFPTVISVGGVDPNMRVNARSNRGNELSLVAPWSVYTTKLGGGYATNQGTSMAAPQVAGIAALVWAKQPGLRAHEVRNILVASAKDLGPKGWDSATGFGLVQAADALATKGSADPFSGNSRIEQAKAIPLDHEISSAWSGSKNKTADWFKLSSKYKGDMRLTLQANRGASDTFHIDFYDAKAHKLKAINRTSAKAITYRSSVTKGATYVKITRRTSSDVSIPYRLTAEFQIAADRYESNDAQDTATELEARSQNLSGTFNKPNDSDWYVLHLPRRSELTVTANTDTARIDLELLLQPDMSVPDIYDYDYEGEPELVPTIQVAAGSTYFIRVRAVSDNDTTLPVAGEYHLRVELTQHYVDTHEPNNTIGTATRLAPGKSATGTFESIHDTDFYQLATSGAGFVTAKVLNVGPNSPVTATLLAPDGTTVETRTVTATANLIKFAVPVKSGKYALRLRAKQASDTIPYRLSYQFDPLVSGFRDISDHWSRSVITKLVQQKVIVPTSSARFEPDRPIALREASDLVRAALGTKTQNIFSVPKSGEKQSISRAQAAEIGCKMLGWNGKFGILKPYSDVGYRYWAISYIRQVKEHKLMRIEKDGKFYPARAITRAEFADMLANVMRVRDAKKR